MNRTWSKRNTCMRRMVIFAPLLVSLGIVQKTTCALTMTRVTGVTIVTVASRCQGSIALWDPLPLSQRRTFQHHVQLVITVIHVPHFLGVTVTAVGIQINKNIFIKTAIAQAWFRLRARMHIALIGKQHVLRQKGGIALLEVRPWMTLKNAQMTNFVQGIPLFL